MSQNQNNKLYHQLLNIMTQFRFFEDLQIDLVLPTFIRGVSDDNLFANFFCPRQESRQEPVSPIQIPPINAKMAQEPVSLPQFDKYITVKQQKKKSQTKQKKDYKKNICGYITKKIVREFMAPIYKQKVQSLCDKYNCSYIECMDYYDKKIQRITGPTHLDMLLNASKQASNLKKCFKQFFIWFLRHRYLRYLIIQGKMERKDIYIDYKNKTLLYLGSIEQEIEFNLSSNESESKQTNSMFTN